MQIPPLRLDRIAYQRNVREQLGRYRWEYPSLGIVDIRKVFHRPIVFITGCHFVNREVIVIGVAGVWRVLGGDGVFDVGVVD